VNPAERDELNDYSIYVLGTFTALVSGAGVVCVRWLWNALPGMAGPAGLNWALGSNPATLSAAYAPALAWSAVAVVLLVARFGQFAALRSGPAGLFLERSLDRTIARCLAPAIGVAAIAALWQGTFLLTYRPGTGSDAALLGDAATGGTALGLGAVFAFIRRWLEASVKPSERSGLLTRLKPQLPKIIANLAVILFVAFVAQVLMALHLRDLAGWARTAGAGVILVAVVLALLDPTRIGLHDFYRGRIARCFLGAAHPRALKPKRERELNRFTHERAQDDFTLGDLQRQTVQAEAADAAAREAGRPGGAGAAEASLPLRPIHLVCCAANNLDGDHLATLYRGARSAVLSQRGLSLGDQTRQLPELGFSSALTASASAFNSQMGAISMAMGPAVAFLTVALNLRLGLWLPHPSGGKPLRPWFPGRLFLRELLGRTVASNPSHPEAPAPDYVHLSDGAHFENFGFYELIRRHCRYVLLCDCGADPENTYDDFATCLRRVREDFGVEVEIDFAPLRPGPDGLSTQHVAVGTIHYDGLGGSDKGTLLYFKPTLTGDEPTDVAQYRRQNPAFPQETTADQFFDEAQWESYRRLGEHAAHVIFRFADQQRADAGHPAMHSRAGEDRQSSAEGIFFRASRLWRPGSRDGGGDLAARTERAGALESSIRDSAPDFLRAEFFPEAAGGGKESAGPRDAQEESRALFFLMQVAQVMEDAWNLCHLGTEAQHPVNEGWMAYIGRWAVIPSFRHWWPQLASMYCDEFRRFIGSRFHLNLVLDPAAKNYARDRITLCEVRDFDETGVAMKEWRRCGRKFSAADFPQATVPVDRFELWFTLESRPGLPGGTEVPLRIQAGFAEVERFHEGDAAIARLTTRDLFVPDSLKGCGFTESLLDHLIHHYSTPRPDVGATSDPPVEMRVRLDRSLGLRDPNARLLRIHLISFFKSRFFAYRRQPGNESTADIDELSRDVRQEPVV